ncbi:MAG: hypothetical protein A2Z18_08410 [Armatimonadetes bacterium RBG_16_58_9]|nr:MAG: hypothetical protein A2Z18_08410 [Armatimonadetes bacterium RBG_16_58_9]
MFDCVRLRAAAIALLALSICGCAWAEVRPRVSVDASAVIINGQQAIRFKVPNGSLSTQQRAEITARRIAQLVSQGVDPKSIYAKPVGKEQARIYAGDTMICIATSGDARAAHTTPIYLADSWASNVRHLLLMPPIVLETQELLVPLGENRLLTVGGAAMGPIYARVANEEVAVVSVDSEGRVVQVLGRQLGETILELSVEGERAQAKVVVMKYAGRAPGVCSAEVTGSPCPAEFIAYAADQAILGAAILEPGARVEVSNLQPTGGALGEGGVRRLEALVKISGEGHIPYSSRTSVDVVNIPMPPDDVDLLFYSNNPERLEKYQTLFAGRLGPDETTRVLYHHQNTMGKRAHLIVEMINSGDIPARLRVTRGISGPLVDTVLVGYIAGKGFLKNCANNVSVIDTIPPRSRLVLVSDFLKDKETASGILQIRQLMGDDVYLRITAAQPWVDDVSMGTIAAAPNPVMLQLSDHIYPSPLKLLEAGYVVGERWAFIPIGNHALDDSNAQKKLYGNYGVTYDINVTLENPTSQTKKVSVMFDPTAGLASGVFIIDGNFVLTKYARPPSEVSLASYSLRPGETRDVRIVTVPLAGSNYPATLVVRS